MPTRFTSPIWEQLVAIKASSRGKIMRWTGRFVFMELLFVRLWLFGLWVASCELTLAKQGNLARQKTAAKNGGFPAGVTRSRPTTPAGWMTNSKILSVRVSHP
jgi:hypothetical protein